MPWYYLALISAFTVALADVFTKKGFAGYSTYSLLLVRFGVPGMMLIPVSLYLGLPPLQKEFWYYLLACIPLELMAMWLYITAIRDYPLHLTLPFLAFTPVFNIVTGYLFLDETVRLIGFTGIMLVVIGTYILNIDHLFNNPRDLLSPFKAILRIRGSVLMLIAAAIYSLTSVLSKGAMLYATPQTFGAFYFVVIGAAAIVFVLATRPRAVGEVLQRKKYMLLIGVSMSIMVIAHFLAIAEVEVAYMISVKRSSLLFGILLGAWLFRDVNLRQHIPAAVIMLIGVILIVNN